MSCRSIRPHSAAAARVLSDENVSVHSDEQWWHDGKVVAALALSPAQQIDLDTIGGRAQNDLGVLEHEAEIAGAFVDDALNAEPFDGTAFEYVVSDYTKRQARIIARELQRAGEIRSVLSQQQWIALQKELGGTALQLQAPTDSGEGR